MDIGLVIKLENIQSIEEYTFKFPKHGIVEFTGDNNHGKSILMKVIKAITSLSIYNDTKRCALIRSGCENGRVFMSNGEIILGFHLDINRGNCRFFYKKAIDKDFIMRTFADKEELTRLIALFGFSTFGKNRLCLQIHEINGIIPFSNNSDPKVDAEIIESITKDDFAEQCLENYKSIVEPALKGNYNFLRSKELNLKQSLESLALYDVSGYQDILTEIEDVIDSAGLYEFILDKIKIEDVVYLDEFSLPKLSFIPFITMFTLGKLSLPIVLIQQFELGRLNDKIKAIREVGNHVCPTCGQVIP